MASSSARTFAEILNDLSTNLKSTESPDHYINALIYCIPLLSTIRVCLEAGILNHLAETQGSLTADAIAQKISDDTSKGEQDEQRDFVIRMVRGVSAFGLVDEVAPFTYQANDLTRTIAGPGFSSGFKLVYDDNMGPRSIMSEMVGYHKNRGWRAADSGEDGPYQRSRDLVGVSAFQHWHESNPVQASRLSDLMQVAQKHRVHYFSWFPEEVLFPTDGADQRVYVDVAGGRGHDVLAVSQAFPKKNVRYILQDLPGVIAETKEAFRTDDSLKTDQIELQVHNFFDAQPVEGADIYFFHKIMHDWPDKDCVRILERIRDAMGPHSRILICDFILPNQGCTVLQTAFDVDMLALHSGIERDEEMWKRLVQKVDGLAVRKLWQPTIQEAEGIVEIVRSVE